MQPVALLPDQPDEAHFRICQKAERNIASMCDGNGLVFGQIKLQKHETLVHQLPATLEVELKPDIVHTEIAGSRPDGEAAGSREDVVAKADARGIDYLKTKETMAELEKHLEEIENKGWGIDPVQIPLKESTKKIYSVVQKCQKCMGSAKLACGTCNMTGVIACGNCGAQGSIACQQCSGSGRVNDGSGNYSPCARCHGVGKATCNTCNGLRTITCNSCRGAKMSPCRECSGSGSWTHLFAVTYHADVSFTLDRELVPQDVMEIVDKFGVKTLASKERAEIFRMPFVLEEKRGHYPALAFFPIGKGEISVAGKHHELLVAGLQAEVVEIAPFLDAYIKKGVSALLKLSKGPMAAEALITQALKLKILRTTLSGLMHHSKKAVYAKVQKDYPLVVSEKYAKASVQYAAQAILAISDGPRNKGLLVGTGASIALSCLYFLTPFRASIYNTLKAKALGQHILLCDILIWVIGYLITLYVVKLMASKALHALLPDEDEKRGGLPAAGKQGAYALLTCFAGWFVVALMAPAKPEWMLSLFKLIGI